MSFRKEVKTFAKARLREQYGVLLAAILLVLAPVYLPLIPNWCFQLMSNMLSVFSESPSLIASRPLNILQGAFGMLSMTASVFFLPFLGCGIAKLSLVAARRQRIDPLIPYREGARGYGRKLCGILLMELFVFLWSLLLIVPGIIKAYSYRFVPYLLAEHPELTPREALNLSELMTHGVKGDLFVFDLSFLGWMIGTSVFPLLAIYVLPYKMVADATLYESIKANALRSGRITEQHFTPARAF